MDTVCATLGWSTNTCWKRLSRAGSFSMYFLQVEEEGVVMVMMGMSAKGWGGVGWCGVERGSRGVSSDRPGHEQCQHP
jgi:hypothetical protein